GRFDETEGGRRQSGELPDALRLGLVHPKPAGSRSAADERNVARLQDLLEFAALPPLAVEDGKEHVGRDIQSSEIPRLDVGKVHLVPGILERGGDGAPAGQADLSFVAGTPSQDGNSHRRLLSAVSQAS